MSVEMQIEIIINSLNKLGDDFSIPKNVKLKLQNAVTTLKEKTELSIRVNKVLSGLDEIADDTNMQPYTRTQIWNIVSLLEKII